MSIDKTRWTEFPSPRNQIVDLRLQNAIDFIKYVYLERLSLHIVFNNNYQKSHFCVSSHGFHILDLGTKRMLPLFSLIATAPFVTLSMLYFNKPSQTTFVLGGLTTYKHLKALILLPRLKVVA
jgi:hypothetical protein